MRCGCLRTVSGTKQRFDIHVCTAANRDYALEAWRLLDPGGILIPSDMRKDRINSDSRVKFLADVMGVGRFPDPPQRRSAGRVQGFGLSNP